MCTSQRYILNRYTGHKIFVKCGHCEACLQEKAARRVGRIKNQDSKDFDVLLVGLTYRRHDVPYVLREDAYKFAHGLLDKLPVYRDCQYRKVRINSQYDVFYRRTAKRFLLDCLDFEKTVSFQGVKDLKYKKDCIGVKYYPDVQNFVSRLRLNLSRNYFYNKEIKTYQCSEYGVSQKPGHGTFRPHFHLLVWVPKGDFEIVRSAIISSWPYGDISYWKPVQNEDGSVSKEYPAVQRAYKAASYVSSYVNCGSHFPEFLAYYFPPQHSWSKGFGFSNDLFSLGQVLSRFERGHVTYYSRKDVEGFPKTVELPYPKYVVSRYFPLFKGYSRFTDASLSNVMRGLFEFDSATSERKWLISSMVNRYASYECPMNYLTEDYKFNVFSYDDLHRFSVMLNNAYERFIRFAPTEYQSLDFDGYANLHRSFYRLYRSDILRLNATNEDVPLYERYDNISQYVDAYDRIGKPLPVGFVRSMIHETDPNKFQTVVYRTSLMRNSFYEHLKHRSVNNSVLSTLYEEF